MTAIGFPKQIVALALVVTCLAIKPARAGLFGPDVESLSPEDLSARLHDDTLLFSASGVALKIHTKGSAVGSFLAGMILTSALSSNGGGGAISAEQLNREMQAKVEISQQASVGIQGLVGEALATAIGQQAVDQAQRGPLSLIALALNKAMIEHQVKFVVSATDPVPALRLTLLQKEWKLDYSMFSNDYRLSSELTMELIDTKANKLHLSHSCRQEYPRKMSLDDWERDDDRAIAVAAEEIAQHCYQEFSHALDLGQRVTTPSAAPEIPEPETERAMKDAKRVDEPVPHSSSASELAVEMTNKEASKEAGPSDHAPSP
jgi:hypothetical protein